MKIIIKLWLNINKGINILKACITRVEDDDDSSSHKKAKRKTQIKKKDFRK